MLAGFAAAQEEWSNRKKTMKPYEHIKVRPCHCSLLLFVFPIAMEFQSVRCTALQLYVFRCPWLCAIFISGCNERGRKTFKGLLVDLHDERCPFCCNAESPTGDSIERILSIGLMWTKYE